MALNATEQALLNVANANLPEWFKANERAQEDVGAVAKQAGRVHEVVRDWLLNTRIQDAIGAVDSDPDWLDQHAVDRGTRRQAGETDAMLRARLRSAPLAVARPDLLSFVAAQVTAAGQDGTKARLVELPRDGAFTGTYTQAAGTGGQFARTGDVVTFTPTTKFPFPPYSYGRKTSTDAYSFASGAVVEHAIVFSGCSSAGNDGTFAVTGLAGDGAKFTNASGIAGGDAFCSWSVVRKDAWGASIEGHNRAFLSRGYRLQRPGFMLIAIIPFGCSEALRASIEEALRTKKSAGVIVHVERDTVGP